jgi:hypothetical protein
MKAGLVGGEGFAVDASLIEADANRSRSMAREEVTELRPEPISPKPIPSSITPAKPLAATAR